MAVKKMKWSAPELIDLRSSAMRGDPEGCGAGSGDAVDCHNGNIALVCTANGTEPGSHGPD